MQLHFTQNMRFYSAGGDSRFLKNVGNHLWNHTVQSKLYFVATNYPTPDLSDFSKKV